LLQTSPLNFSFFFANFDFSSFFCILIKKNKQYQRRLHEENQ
jgi:hypothetical protein